MKNILYTTNNCPKCDFIKGEILDKNLKIEVVNIQENADAYEFLKKQNIMEAPILAIGDKMLRDVPKMLMELEEMEEMA